METNVNEKTEKVNIKELLAKTHVTQLPSVPQIEERFKYLYALIHQNNDPKKVAAFFEAEKFHFNKLINDNPKLKECTKLSLYGCLLDVAVNGLSFDPSFKHLYLVPRNHNVGTQQSPKWEKRAHLEISGYGELALRIMQNQIKYADNPILVYGSDLIKYGTKDNKSFVEHENILPRKDSTIVMCYLKITRLDGSIDYKWITQEDMDRFRKFSKEPNSKAWVDGEGGMWQAKCIKHAFKNYPKVRTGTFSQLATETEDTEAEEIHTKQGTMHIPANINYGIDEDDEQEATNTVNGEAEIVDDKKKADNEFLSDNPPPKQQEEKTVTRTDNDW